MKNAIFDIYFLETNGAKMMVFFIEKSLIVLIYIISDNNSTNTSLHRSKSKKPILFENIVLRRHKQQPEDKSHRLTFMLETVFQV